MRNLLFLVAALTLIPSSYADNKKQREDREPEATTGYYSKKAHVAKQYMVSTANPYASWVGKQVIKRGGNAIDAAVAIQAMLTLVEPQSSGIGGGSFILYWDNKNKRLHTFDGRETAPDAANQYLFIKDRKSIPWKEAVVGGRSVGVPGTLKALEMAQKEFGKLAWKDLFNEAIDTAYQGFTVSQRLETLLSWDLHPGLKEFNSSKRYFYPNGEYIKQGTVQKNGDFAAVLFGIAKEGSDFFYKGDLAKQIAKTVQTSTINPGLLEESDINNYQAKKRDPVCGNYKTYKICGMAPPASGGISVFQILKMLEDYKLEQYKPNQLEAVHLITQSSRLAFADREAYIADPDFTHLPFGALINNTYLQKRLKLIDPAKDMKKARAGSAYSTAFIQVDNAFDLPNTSHISIVDKEGNAVSMTSSIEYAFGSGLMVEGFLLNNQLTDFAFLPNRGKYKALNRVQAGKRPRSSMSPTMVFDEEGELYFVIGSPGGSRIINYVAQTLVGVLDWGLDVQQAINLPKFTHRNDYVALEEGTDIVKLQQGLEKLGHEVKIIDLNSGLHGILIKDGKLIGGADPRREGVAVGE
nr:gamma-glutamyltransferase [Paraneptunicella aestuarii]